MSARAYLAMGAVLLGLGTPIVFGAYAVSRPGPLQHVQNSVVPRGSSAVVATMLHRAGIVRSVWLFRVAETASTLQGRLRSGEFAFPAHATLWQVLTILRHGRPVEHFLTIPEGFTSWHIAKVLAEAPTLIGSVSVPREGEVLPQTYAYQSGTESDSVLSRARQAMDETIARVWRERDAGLPLQSARELLIVASLVERETHLSEERPLVARVFLNRLERGMRLQSDPTVVYGESGGRGELVSGLRRDALDRASPYNTYVLSSLPTGPICSPGLASLLGVAHPMQGSALYFVANGKGGHAFSGSLAEHKRNVARYRSSSQ